MADKCATFGEELEHAQVAAECGKCDVSFQPACCGKCLDVGKLRSAPGKWQCEGCKVESPSSQTRPGSTLEPAAVFEMFKALRGDVTKHLEESRKRFDCLATAHEEVNTTLEECKGKMGALEKDYIDVNERYEEREKKLIEATRTIETLQRDVLDLQQKSKDSDVEIKGVPLEENEEVYSILEDVAKALEVPFNCYDISMAHRLPARKRDVFPTIVASFVMRSTRDMWLQAAKKKRLYTSDVTPRPGQPGNVFVNPHLAGHNRAILGRAKRLVREGRLHAAWTNDSRIMFKRRRQDSATRARRMGDLDEFDK